MKYIIFFIALLVSIQVGAQYNPVLHTVTNKPYGMAQAGPTDARSQYYDAGTFSYRPFASTAECLSYLNIAKYRTGKFSIYILDSDGNTREYWFRNGVADADLVEKFADASAVEGGYIHIITAYQSAPPVSPSVGDTVLVRTPGTGAFAGNNNKLMGWNGISWGPTTAAENEYAYKNSTGEMWQLRNGVWVKMNGVFVKHLGNTLANELIVGTNNAQSLKLETNNVNRLEITSAGAIKALGLTGGSKVIASIGTDGTIERLSLGTNLSITGSTLNATAGGGTQGLDDVIAEDHVLTTNRTIDYSTYTLTEQGARKNISLTDSANYSSTNTWAFNIEDTFLVRALLNFQRATVSSFSSATRLYVGTHTGSGDTTGLSIYNSQIHVKGATTGTGSIGRIDATSKVISYSSTIDASTELTNNVQVENGGTERSTLTSGAVLLGNGTGAVAMLQGTVTNQVLTWDGSAWVAGTTTNYWARGQYAALASTNILQPATLTDTTVIGSGLAALSGLFNVQGRTYLVGNVGINTAPSSATFGLNVAAKTYIQDNMRVDGNVTIGTLSNPGTASTTPSLTIGNGPNGNNTQALVSGGAYTNTTTPVVINQFNNTTAKTSAAAGNGVTWLEIGMTNTVDGSSTHTAAYWQGVFVTGYTKSNSTTAIPVVVNFDAAVGVTNSRTQTFTTVYGYRFQPIANYVSGGIISSGGNLYAFYADSTHPASYAGGSATGFKQKANSVNTIKNNFEGNFLVGSGTINASAAMEIISTVQGFLPPRMTKTQRDAISSPATGLTIWQTDNTPGLRSYNGTNWMRYTETAD